MIFTIGIQQTKAEDCDCGSCHGADQHSGDSNWQGCSGCHDSPPQTGTHLVHYNSDPIKGLVYGDIALSSVADAYKFGCGNCHPLDNTFHMDNILQVELYNTESPEGSIKSLNPAGAEYTAGPQVTTYAHKIAGGPDFSYSNGTCSNVYCHSYNDWTTPLPQYTTLLECTGNGFTWTDGACYGVPTPWTPAEADWPVPSNTVTTRHYRTQTWGGGPLTCSGCHANSPYTAYPTNDGGAGDSHSWIDQNGLNNLHMNNMTLDRFHEPINCRICHNDTIADPSPVSTDWISTFFDYEGTIYASYTGWYDYPFPTFGDVAIDDFSKHVNGTVNVAFDEINSVEYSPTAIHIQTVAAYEPSTKTCSNVSCHKKEAEVTWGTPYRYYENIECYRCHGPVGWFGTIRYDCYTCHPK